MTSPEHPLVQTLNQLAEVSERFRTRLLPEPDAEPGWLSAAELADAGAPHVPDLLGRVAARYQTSDKHAPAALWFGHYAYAVAATPIACYLAAQRVPRLALEGVWVRFNEDGNVGALAWPQRSFAALAGDAAAAHPDCTALAGRDALRDWLRAELVAHLTPVVEATRVHSTFSKAGMWALAADYCASLFTWIGRLGHDEAGGAAEARLFAATPSPLRRKRDFIHVAHCGLDYYLTDRTACCLYYKVDSDHSHYCSTCPLRPPEERVARVKGWLEQEAAEAVQA